jgi:hypothetical protein
MLGYISSVCRYRHPHTAVHSSLGNFFGCFSNSSEWQMALTNGVSVSLDLFFSDRSDSFELSRFPRFSGISGSSQRQSQSCLTTDGGSASLSWCQASTWNQRPISLFSAFEIIIRQLVVTYYMKFSRTRQWVIYLHNCFCALQVYLDLCV